MANKGKKEGEKEFTSEVLRRMFEELIAERDELAGLAKETLEMKFYKYIAFAFGCIATVLLGGGILLLFLTGVLFSVITGSTYYVQSFATYVMAICAAVVFYYLTWLLIKRYQQVRPTAVPT
jgi:hypothetical protein